MSPRATASPPKDAEAKDPPKKKARSKPKSLRPGAGVTGSGEAKRRASLVLEVLSGIRSPFDASVVLGVSLQRYYLLEARALQGLVEALEPKPAGRQPSLEGALLKLQAERDRMARELMRAQAHVRAAHRTIGITPPEAARDKVKGAGKKKRKRPSMRARQAVARLRAEANEASEDGGEAVKETVSIGVAERLTTD